MRVVKGDWGGGGGGLGFRSGPEFFFSDNIGTRLFGPVYFFQTESYKYRGFRDNFMLNNGFRDNYALNAGFHNKFRLNIQVFAKNSHSI